MPSFRTGVVTAVVCERPGLQRVEVDGRPAYVLTGLIGPVGVADEVVVNTTAVELGLGTGGSDVVHWNLSRRQWSAPGAGHVMKLRYTSLQADTGVVEEHDSYREPTSLGSMPVVACGLHSQVACVAVASKHLTPGLRLVYVMTDGAALPLAVSDLVHDLLSVGAIDATVTAGQAFGGDYEAVNVASALAVARETAAAHALVVGPGPGGVGTATTLGYSALEAAGILDTAAVMGGQPVVALRWSGVDVRQRHRGVSHHSVTVLTHARAPVQVPVPRGGEAPLPGNHRLVTVDVPDMAELLTGRGLALTTMGRGVAEDPGFFSYAGAAGALASLAAPPVPGQQGEIR